MSHLPVTNDAAKYTYTFAAMKEFYAGADGQLPVNVMREAKEFLTLALEVPAGKLGNPLSRSAYAMATAAVHSTFPEDRMSRQDLDDFLLCLPRSMDNPDEPQRQVLVRFFAGLEHIALRGAAGGEHSREI